MMNLKMSANELLSKYPFTTDAAFMSANADYSVLRNMAASSDGTPQHKLAMANHIGAMMIKSLSDGFPYEYLVDLMGSFTNLTSDEIFHADPSVDQLCKQVKGFVEKFTTQTF